MHHFVQLATNILQNLFHFLTGKYFKQIDPRTPTYKIMPPKKIVILGASFAGVSTAHRLLKQSVKTPMPPFKVTLISPNSHFYWNIALPRAIIPGEIPDEKIFQSIPEGFKQYPANQFEFILGSAEYFDTENKNVQIIGPSGSQTMEYDYLVLGTGSHTNIETPFKGRGTTEATKEALHAFQAEVKKAKTIVIAGAGVTGTEVTGELGSAYGNNKEITLVRPPSLSSLYDLQYLINISLQVVQQS